MEFIQSNWYLILAGLVMFGLFAYGGIQVRILLKYHAKQIKENLTQKELN